MRILIIALAVCTIAGPVKAQVSDAEVEETLDAQPEWVRKPDGEDLHAVLPREAMRKGINGRATIRCQVSLQGTLEACEVASEKPAGMGFGQAALLLAPSFVLKPGVKDGKPVSTSIRIPVHFDVGGPTAGTSLQRAPMVTEAVWEQAPSFADMASAWPKGATAEFGHVSLRCRVEPDGLLERCEVITETPRGQGFGKAARALATSKFRMRVTNQNAAEVAKASINLPIRFNNPTGVRPQSITKPRWITQIDPKMIVEIYPDAAAKAGVKSGRGVADCAVARDGSLADCKPAPATPEGLGFSETAVQVAKIMRMNPWSDGGGPVDGVRIRLPITFNLAPEDEPPAAEP